MGVLSSNRASGAEAAHTLAVPRNEPRRRGAPRRWLSLLAGLTLLWGAVLVGAALPASAGKASGVVGAAAAVDLVPPQVPGDPRTSKLTCNSVTLAWNASTDNVGVAFYDVYHDGQLMKSVGGTTLSTSLTVVPGVTWGLYVNARDAAGNVSQASATVPITPPQCQIDTQAPTRPARAHRDGVAAPRSR